MKKILLSFTILTLSASALFAQKKTIADVAKFTSETIDFGKLKQGNPTKGTFTVTNIGKDPLIIEQANPTCGCTISDYTKAPIAPGKTGVINATYNAANAGHFDKHLTVKFAGVDEIKSITFTGEVLTVDAYAKWETENAARMKAVADSTAAANANVNVKTKKKRNKTTSATTAPATTN